MSQDAESIFHTMRAGPRPLTTVLVVKPDVVGRHLGKLMKKLRHEGFTLAALKLTVLTEELAEGIVPTEDATVSGSLGL